MVCCYRFVVLCLDIAGSLRVPTYKHTGAPQTHHGLDISLDASLLAAHALRRPTGLAEAFDTYRSRHV